MNLPYISTFVGDTRLAINTLRRDEKYILCNVLSRNLKEINPAIRGYPAITSP
jgi:hypothetical protein